MKIETLTIGIIIGVVAVVLIWILNPMNNDQFYKMQIDSLKTENKTLLIEIEFANKKLDIIELAKVSNKVNHDKKIEMINTFDADSLYDILNKTF